jgi:hypothetical protein
VILYLILVSAKEKSTYGWPINRLTLYWIVAFPVR